VDELLHATRGEVSSATIGTLVYASQHLLVLNTDRDYLKEDED
jgi:hypothetical protein